MLLDNFRQVLVRSANESGNDLIAPHRPSKIGEYQLIYGDREHLSIDQNTIAVEDDQLHITRSSGHIQLDFPYCVSLVVKSLFLSIQIRITLAKL